MTSIFAASLCFLCYLCSFFFVLFFYPYFSLATFRTQHRGDYDKRTALHIACAEGNTEMVDLLIRKKCNVNVEDRWKGTPLHDAKMGNHTQIIELLTAAGAIDTDVPVRP